MRIFGYAVAQHIIQHNPAQWLDKSYAGGESEGRDRNLSRDELVRLFAAMRGDKDFGRENYLTVQLLLMLGVRKNELAQSKKAEFNLDAGEWALPKDRTKTKAAVDIPLPKQAVEALKELFWLSGDSEHLLPARGGRNEHISHATINMALKRAQGIDGFTVYDLRRTAKSRLQELGIDEFISERCLNRKLSGMAKKYGKHDFFNERKHALQLLVVRAGF
ncbi:site-specific integrase [Methyloglobulus sp.]|uniref:tyrosine-type recombinase/integrase n=1 Tax=Methyloglobulus sp. TaxID=2518622 RepID=UPI0032B7466C